MRGTGTNLTFPRDGGAGQEEVSGRGSFAQTSRVKTSVRAFETLEKQTLRCGHPGSEGPDVHDRSEKLGAESSLPIKI